MLAYVAAGRYGVAALHEIAAAVRAYLLRAGLCACADLGCALEQLFGKGRPVERVLQDQTGRELVGFWLSPRCVSALREMGLAL